MQLYGISVTRPYKQSGRWQDVFDTLDVDMEDQHLDVRHMSKTQQ